jgi:hypothetical protein
VSIKSIPIFAPLWIFLPEKLLITISYNSPGANVKTKGIASRNGLGSVVLGSVQRHRMVIGDWVGCGLQRERFGLGGTGDPHRFDLIV